MKNILPFLFLTWAVYGQTPQLELEYFAFGLNHPVDIAKAPGDNRLFVAEQGGKIRIVDPVTGVILPQPFLDLTGIAVQPSGNEQGLLGLAFDRNYNKNGRFFVNYIDSAENTVITCFARSDTNANVANPEGVHVLTIQQPFTNHNGGCLRFGRDGYLYIATGDGGFSVFPADPYNNAQNPQSLLGKMLRINVDGLPYSVPFDNPYYFNPLYRPEIWAMGLRNPWRFSFDDLNGDLWIGDVGNVQVDEVDYHAFGDPPGQNFGWRCYEGTLPYEPTSCADTTVVTPPVFEYANIGGFCGASVIGGAVYRGTTYPGLQGWYICFDFCTGNFYGIKKQADGTFLSANIGHFDPTYNYCSMAQGPDGELYIAGYIAQGLYRVKDKCQLNPAPTPIIAAINDTMTATSVPGATYQWYWEGVAIPGATDTTLIAEESGHYQVLLTAASGCQTFSDTLVVTLTKAGILENTFPVLELFPNPARDRVFYALKLANPQEMTLSVFDFSGKIVEHLIVPAGQTTGSISVENLPEGNYWFVATNLKDITLKQAFIKTKF